MSSSNDTPGSTSCTTPSHSRQQPGLACDECRARKLRCDRQRPTCSLCQSLGAKCARASTSLPRGPKKGHIRLLQSKIDDLERRLGGTEPFQSQPSVQPQLDQSMLEGTKSPHEPTAPRQCFSSDTGEQGIMALDHLAPDLDLSIDYFMMQTPPGTISDPTLGFDPASTFNTCDSDIHLTSGALEPQIPTFMTTVMQADLDQMYFDRVHIFVPMLHQKRYVVRSRLQNSVVPSFDCLRHTVWIMAGSVCNQSQNIQDMLYVQAKTSLEALELNSHECSNYLEEAQAWVLLSMYEMKHLSFRKGWISAGRAIRLVHLMKLHEVDMPAGLDNNDHVTEAQDSESSWTEVEERRRTFWMAYCLDRLVNLLNQVPFTINEQSIFTRLPASEEDFQAGRQVDTAFLFEVLRGPNKRKLSSFNNLLILVTLWGRGLLYRHRRLVDRFYGNEGTDQDFCHRLQWLDSILAQTEQIMAANDNNNTDSLDSMLLFTNMVAHTMFVSLCRIGKNTHRDSMSKVGPSNVINGYEAGLSRAVTKMSALSNALGHYGQSNIHPFAAIPLYCCADFLQSTAKPDALQSFQLEQILYSLQELALSNVVAQTCLRLLGPKML